MRREKWRLARTADERFFFGSSDVFARDKRQPMHSLERYRTPDARPGERHLRIVARRRVREASQRRCLTDAQLTRRRIEVERARRGDTDGALPQLDAIEILLEDLSLAEMRVEAQCEHGLNQFAADVATRRTHQTRELHRDRRRARDDAMRADVVADSANDGSDVDTVMVPEATIFDGDEGVDHVGVDAIIRDPACVAAVVGSRVTEYDAVAILDRHAASRIEGEDVGRERQCDEHQNGARHGSGDDSCRVPEMSRGNHRGVTTNVPPSLRPFTPGLYISSVCAGGLMNVPGVVARARYVAVYVPGQSSVAE